jgi:hypothetical protein
MDVGDSSSQLFHRSVITLERLLRSCAIHRGTSMNWSSVGAVPGGEKDREGDEQPLVARPGGLVVEPGALSPDVGEHRQNCRVCPQALDSRTSGRCCLTGRIGAP